MPLHTRRTLLQAATALTAGLAGCNGSSGSTTRSATMEAGGSVPSSNSATDPAQLLVRAEDVRLPLRLTNTETEPTENELDRPVHHFNHEVVSTQETAANLTVAEGVTTDADLDAFVSETDFDSESLYLETNSVPACFTLTLCYISWAESEISTDYARTLREYDESCSATAQASESRLIRLPVALDEDAVRSFGMSIGSGPCDRGGDH